jgi:hypothetical protein
MFKSSKKRKLEAQKRELEAQQRKEDYSRTTTAPLEFLLAAGVDSVWANEYLGFVEKLDHFTSSFWIFFNLSPRLIRLAILRPDTLVRLMKKKFESSPDCKPDETWEQVAYDELEQWNAPKTMSWNICELLEAIDSYAEGISPMDTIIEAHSDCDDGQEDDPVYAGSPDMIGLLMTVAFLVMLVFGAFTYFRHASEAAKALAGS